MSKDRLTKAEMQRDELQEVFVEATGYVASHKNQTYRWIAIGAGALVLVVGGLMAFKAMQAKAGEKLSDALGVYDAPLVADGVQLAAGQQVYKDAAERSAAAVKALEAAKGSSAPGKAAAVALLASQGAKGVTGTAVDEAKALASSASGSIVGGTAAAAVLDAEAAAGRTKEAIELAKKYLESSDSPLPKDVLIFYLAKLNEKAGQQAEARVFYQRLVTDFPDSPYRFDAQQKVSNL